MKKIIFMFLIISLILYGCSNSIISSEENIKCNDNNCTNNSYDTSIKKCIETKQKCYNENVIIIKNFNCYGNCYKTDTINLNGTATIVFELTNNGNEILDINAKYQCNKINSGQIVFENYNLKSNGYFAETLKNNILLNNNSSAIYKIVISGKPTINTELSCNLNFKFEKKEATKQFYLIIRA